MYFRIVTLFSLLFSLQLTAQTVVSTISFFGNDYFSNSDLHNAMVNKRDKQFNKDQFNLDLKSIREKYRDAGYLLAKIIKSEIIYDTDSVSVDLNITLEEGKRVNVGIINIAGNKVLSTREIFNLFETKTGKPLDGNTLNNDIKELLDNYEKKGIPFAKAYVENVSLYYDGQNPKTSISILISEESKVKIEQVRIKGNDVTNDDVIIRELKISNDKYIKRESMQNMKSRLEKLNIFETVEDPKIYTLKKTGKTGLLIQVKEGNTNTFDGVIGYAPAVSDKESGYFTGLINLSFRNIFGTGRRIDAKWQKPLKSTQELEFKYGEPYFVGLPLNLNFGFMQRIQDTSYTQRKIDFKGDFLFTDKFTASFLGGYDRVIPTDDTTRTFVTYDSRILYGGFELKYDTRDNVYIPQSGIIYKLFYSYGDKKIDYKTIIVGILKSNYSIKKYAMDLDIYSSFFKRQTLLLKFFGGYITSDKLEDADFYRIGGNKNIRGYREEQFLASQIAYSNTEIRYSISRKSFLYGFFDYGYYFRPSDDINSIPKQEGFLYGYGLGIRLETAIGLVGVNYALGKGDGFSDGKINFGLINDF
ncbi:MAG: BamA/TamA family outer membrane protein [Ignavibacteriae bacterium]|nr:BamA/TamA family outer membrane protein [Ignavibacteriota bacterium]